MIFDVKYTRLGNKFFFISNLSEWHFSCRKNYNIVWINKIKNFSSEEQFCLKDISDILKKYNFSKYIGKIFILEKEPENVWKKLKKTVNKNEFEKIKNIFDIFEEKFKKNWNEKLLENNIKTFNKELNRNCYNKIDNYLNTFLGEFKKNKVNKINIYLLKHPVQNWYIAGGANLGDKGITLECNRLIYPRHESVELAAAVSYHELIHVFYQKKIEKIINNVSLFKNNKTRIIVGRSLKEIIIEIVINSLFPKGYLANKYLHYQPYKNMEKLIKRYEESFNKFKKGNNINFNDLFYYIVYKLFPLTKNYIENRKKIDKKYIETILKYLEI